MLTIGIAMLFLAGNAHSCDWAQTLLNVSGILLTAKNRYNSEGS
jgi:hypothetical protein